MAEAEKRSNGGRKKAEKGSQAYSVGAGALIPYKRGDDDVGWFISYSHS